LPFEDGRSDTTRLGVRHHLGGGETYFNVSDGKPGDKVAEVVAAFLRQKGWRAEVVKDPAKLSGNSIASQTSSGGSGMASIGDGYDVTLTGKVLELNADVNSGFMKTKVGVNSKLLLQGLNAADGSTVRMTLSGAGSEDVFWFSAEDVQAVLNEVLAESLEKLDADMNVDGKLLRFK
jgi:hypothetical protein